MAKKFEEDCEGLKPMPMIKKKSETATKKKSVKGTKKKVK